MNNLENLKIEKQEIELKYHNHLDYINTPNFNELYYEQKHLIKQKTEILGQYLKLLKKQIRLITYIEADKYE